VKRCSLLFNIVDGLTIENLNIYNQTRTLFSAITNIFFLISLVKIAQLPILIFSKRFVKNNVSVAIYFLLKINK